MATPFVQGQLQRRALSGAIHTACACCAEPMCIEFDAALRCRAQRAPAPVISVPMVNLGALDKPNIVDDF